MQNERAGVATVGDSGPFFLLRLEFAVQEIAVCRRVAPIFQGRNAISRSGEPDDIQTPQAPPNRAQHSCHIHLWIFWRLGLHARKLQWLQSTISIGQTMDQDADKPDELVLDLDALAAEFDAKTRDADVPTTLLRSHDDASPYNDEHVLFDESGDENLSSQLAMLESSVELTGGVTVYKIPDDKPAPPKPVVAVETPSLIQRIARLFFGGSR